MGSVGVPNFGACMSLIKIKIERSKARLVITGSLLWLCAVLSCSQAASAAAEKPSRLALVIGNDAYKNVPSLRNAKSDAEAVSAALSEVGFEVTFASNLNEKALKGAVRDFIGRLSGGDEAIFFFAGHGVQLGAANYLLPTDVAAEDEGRVLDEALPLQRVLDALSEQRVRFSLAIVDACRNNPFPPSRERSIKASRGLAPTNPASGQMVMFSAGAGQSALDLLDDRDRSRNGVFTRVLLREMRKEGVSADQVLRNVRDEVVRLARSVNHEQVPALYDQSIGRFYFRPTASVNASRISTALSDDATASVRTADDSGAERLFWESIKDSRSPDEFRAYLRKYPTGVFAELAQVRLKALTTSLEVARPTASADKKGKEANAEDQKIAERTRNDDSVSWVKISAGPFKSGAGGTSLKLGEFKISKTEVTNREYREYLESCPAGDVCGPRSLPPYWDDQDYLRIVQDNPVVFVSYDDAVAYCRWRDARLPSAEEWEKAARGESGDLYPGGSKITFGSINILGSENRSTRRNAAPRQIPTWSVTDSRYAQDKSAFGVLGMGGNVSEWTSTVAGSRQDMRLTVGASWDSWELTDALAYQTIPKRKTDKSSSLGFRCARD
jgi:formylglycine-generating enzyme required for sulfatase activity